MTINQLADLIAEVAEFEIVKRHVPGPQSVRGRNSDNSLLRKTLHWEPKVALEDGLTRTYELIEQQVALVHGEPALVTQANLAQCQTSSAYS